MMKKVLFLFFVLMANSLHAQKEDYIWYFGRTGAGLDFHECNPVVLTDGAHSQAWEGTATMCDAVSGQLLFYTDGVFIYNANHSLMTGNPAGIWNTSTQNIIIRKPGITTIYYLISPEGQAACSFTNTNYPKGINYSIIDMSLNGGLGGITASHVALIDTQNCEKIIAVRNSNGQDIWLIAHRYHSDKFMVFNVTSSGINPILTYYSIGPSIYTYQSNQQGYNCFDAIGELKASPNGTKLAFTTYYNGITAVFDFDNSTGVISNSITLNLGWGGYGVSFSPDNSKLYIAGGDPSTITSIADTGRIYQFDLSSNDSAAIQNSKTLIYSCLTAAYGSIKLAPNGKIYVTTHTGNVANGSAYLDVINSPNVAGLACNYVHNALYLGLASTWGLNNIMETNNYCISTGNGSLENKNYFISIYPDPAHNTFTISLNQLTVDNGQLTVFDITGREVYHDKIVNRNSYIVNQNFSPGIYFVRVEAGEKVWTEKVVVE
jgi:hypothetical protein